VEARRRPLPSPQQRWAGGGGVSRSRRTNRQRRLVTASKGCLCSGGWRCKSILAAPALRLCIGERAATEAQRVWPGTTFDRLARIGSYGTHLSTGLRCGTEPASTPVVVIISWGVSPSSGRIQGFDARWPSIIVFEQVPWKWVPSPTIHRGQPTSQARIRWPGGWRHDDWGRTCVALDRPVAVSVCGQDPPCLGYPLLPTPHH